MAKIFLSKGNAKYSMEVTSSNKQIRIVNRLHSFLEKYPTKAPLGHYLSTLRFIVQFNETDQIRARKTIELCVSKITHLLTKKQKPSFLITSEAISTLSRITHELRHIHQMSHVALQHLIAHIKITLYSNKTLMLEEQLKKHLGNILNALFATQINFYRHFQFFIDLSMLYVASEHFNQPHNTTLLWKTSALRICTQQKDEYFDGLFDNLTRTIAQESNTPEISPFQKALEKDLKNILSPTVITNMQQEYNVGAYSLDFAFPNHKLNIEADGSFYHCLGGKIYQCKFLVRDYILTQLFGWTVIRISSRDYFKHKPITQRMQFLSDKLKDFPQLLHQTNLIVPRTRGKSPSFRKRFPDLDELDIHSKHFKFMLQREAKGINFFQPPKQADNYTKLVTLSSPLTQEPDSKRKKKKKARKNRAF